MDNLNTVLHSALENLIKRIKIESQQQKCNENCERNKKRKTENESNNFTYFTQCSYKRQSFSNDDNLEYYSNNDLINKTPKESTSKTPEEDFLFALYQSRHHSAWELKVFLQVIESACKKDLKKRDITRANYFLQAIWQRLHTG